MAGCLPDIEALAPDDLKGLVLQLLEDVVALKAENAALREEIARLKGLKGPPKLKPSGMEKATEPARAERKAGRRGGKIDRLVIDEERVLKAAVPPGSRFKGYETYVVQELILRPHVIRYRRERWITPDGRTVVAALPAGTVGHFGPELRRFVLAQYHPGQVTVPRIVAHLRDLGMAISKRQVVRLLIAGKEDFLAEAAGVLKSGLESAAWITVDDTGARYKGMNGACTHIGNTDFAWFATTRAKSRLNFLALLRAGATDYVINDEALAYMRGRSLSGLVIARLHANKVELLRALERPDIPLHTNGSENDIRCQVTRRKISGGTRSETGRDCRDAFLGLMKTCDKLGVSFWDYLGSRLDIPGAPPILPLPDLIRQRAAA